MKLIVAGSRDFTDYIFLSAILDKLLSAVTEDIEIVSGTARGADLLGEKYAEENEIPIKRFPADWDRLGKSAGYIRNLAMAEYATHCVCFWDGKSPGTASMIALAERLKLGLRVIRTDLRTAKN